MTLSEFLTRFPPPGLTLFAKVWGSRSHDTQVEGSDTDFAGVYLVPTSQLLSLAPPPDTVKCDSADKESNPDRQFHEVGKFCSLLLVGNPGIVETLFTDRMMVSSPEWECLRSQSHRFLSKRVVRQYLGYAQGQLGKFHAHGGKRGLHSKGGQYSEKWGYHAVRILLDAERIARGACPSVWKEGEERELLMRIRRYEVGMEEVVTTVEAAVQRIDNLAPWPLPEEGDAQFLEAWLLGLRKENW